MTLEVYDMDGGFSSHVVTLGESSSFDPAGPPPTGLTNHLISFSSFSGNANFAKVGAFQILIDGSTAGTSVALGSISLGNADVAAVPEPSVFLMSGIGIAAGALVLRRRRSKEEAGDVEMN